MHAGGLLQNSLRQELYVKLGQVIGTVVSTQKLECFDRKKILLVQQIDENRKPLGNPFAAVDTVQAGEGDIVMYEGGKEAAQALDNWFNPCDASVIGIIDGISAENSEKNSGKDREGDQ